MAKTVLNSLSSASYEQLSAIVTDIVALIKSEDVKVTNAYKALVGELGNKPLAEGETEAVPHTVVSYIAAKIAEINGAADVLEGRVLANENAITLLNNNAETVGSVDYKINQAFNDFVTKVSNDEVVNTFKEMIDYVAAHKTEYANLGALVGTLPAGATSTTVVGYAKEVADAAQAEADARIKAIEDDYLKAADKTELTNAIGTAKSEAIAAVQGETENTVKDLEDAVNGFSYLSAEQVAAIKALIA